MKSPNDRNTEDQFFMGRLLLHSLITKPWNSLRRIFGALVLIVACGSHSSIWAQGGSGELRDDSPGPRKQVATIIFAGLAGSILGLSTLSFYGRPQDKLSNIAVGAAIGVIIGAGFTTFQAATKPREFYSLLEDQSFPLPLNPSNGHKGHPVVPGETQWSDSGREEVAPMSTASFSLSFEFP